MTDHMADPVIDPMLRAETLHRMDIEIARLVSETSRINLLISGRNAKLYAEPHHPDRTSPAQIDATIARLMAATTKLDAEHGWYRFIAGSGVTLAIMALAKLLGT